MKRLNAILGALLMAVFAGTCLATTAAAKVAIVDMAKVYKEYDKAKEAQTRLEKDIEDRKEELKKMTDKLEKQQADLAAKKGIVSDSKYESLKSKVQDDQDAVREKYREMQTSLMKKQQDVMESIMNEIREVAAQIAKSEKYEVVLDKAGTVYGGEDITYKVLDLLNRKK